MVVTQSREITQDTGSLAQASASVRKARSVFAKMAAEETGV
jgi:hypothetical protein